jgi:hypothetical protein
MNWEAAGAAGEILGAIAVLTTLIYLARQIKDHSKEVRQASIVAINDLVNDAFEPVYYNDRNIHIWATGHNDPDALTDEDKTIFSLFMARLANVHLTAFSQYKYETLDNDEYLKYVKSLKSLLDTPGGVAWLTKMGGGDLVSDETRKLLDQVNEVQRYVVPMQTMGE